AGRSRRRSRVLEQRAQLPLPEARGHVELIGRVDQQQSRAVQRYACVARIEPQLQRRGRCREAQLRARLPGGEPVLILERIPQRDDRVGQPCEDQLDGREGLINLGERLLIGRIDEDQCTPLRRRQARGQRLVAIGALDL